jgi:hypothetical protein
VALKLPVAFLELMVGGLLVNHGSKAARAAFAAPAGGGSAATSSAPTAGGGPTGGANSGVSGNYTLASGANRPGVGLRAPIVEFLGHVAGGLGHAVTVGTGTQHNQYVAGEPGVQSDHWTGDAADVPAVGVIGDAIAAAALRALGWSRAEAARMAAAGGVFNRTTNGVHYQVLWKTMVGGNHFNHVHLGARAL